MRIVRTLVATIILVSLCVAQAPAPGSARALPLNRFPVSRAAQSSPGGFFKIAFAIGDDYFDGKDSRARVRRHMEVAREVGAKYLRCAFSWNGIEPEQGKYQFKFWDMLVEEAGKAGIQLIPYVAYTPEWAARTSENFWEQPPKDPEMFRVLMRTLAIRYKGKIISWELWNEPDLKEYWQGSPAEFAELVKKGAVGVREGNPDAVIVLGGMSHGPGEFFQSLMNDFDIYRWVDVLAMHGYPESWDEERAEEAFGPRIDKMESYASQHGVMLDVWLNEMGYSDYRYKPAKASLWGTDIYYRYEHTQRYASDFLFRSFALTLSSNDVSLAGWYRIDDFRHSDPRMPTDKVHYHLGLMDIRGKPKPAFFAMRFAAKLLEAPVRAEPPKITAKRDSQAVVRLFERKDGTLILTGWLRSSLYNELTRHTGIERDTRKEVVNVQLPCKAATVTTFTATGKRLTTGHPQSTELKNIPLFGSRTYIAKITCAQYSP